METITANPKTAGVARWNFLALWGHLMRKGDAAALDYVTKVRHCTCLTHAGDMCIHSCTTCGSSVLIVQS